MHATGSVTALAAACRPRATRYATAAPPSIPPWRLPTLDGVFDGLADFIGSHFESGSLDALVAP